MRLKNHFVFDEIISQIYDVLKFRYAFLEREYGLDDNGPMAGTPVQIKWFAATTLVYRRLFFQPGNERELTHKIQEVLPWDDSKRQEYSISAKKRAAEFSWDKACSALVQELKIAARNGGTKLK